MFTIEIQDESVKVRLNAMPGKVHNQLRNAVDKLAIMLQAYVRGQKLSGQVLKFHTHNLQQSIQRRIEDSDTKITGVVFANSSLAPYAKIHEDGAVFSRMVTMAWGHKVKNPRSVTFHYPQRSFLKSSLRDNEEKIVRELKAAAILGTK